MWKLFLISVLALFLELVLIRWVGTEVNIFAYLQNTVLVVCFMGLGMGCLTCRQPILIRNYLAPLLVLVLLLSLPVTRTGLQKTSLLLSSLGDVSVLEVVQLGNSEGAPLQILMGLAITFGLMFLIWQIFVPIGRTLGRLMDDHPRPIEAYSVNILGSLVGIWGFVVLGILYQPPVTWVLVVSGLTLYFIRGAKGEPRPRFNLVLLVAVLLLAWFSGKDAKWLEVFWSPYQKLVLTKSDVTNYPSFRYFVTVNNSWYQGIMDLSLETTASDPKLYPPEEQGLTQYDIPFLVHPHPEKVLIVGSGTGNDVAGALRQGVENITAVEIDPAIIKLGTEYHPEKPYLSPTVTVVNDDARSFFATSKTKYDVISFGLLDAHTTTAMTNAPLDHYVYTKESLQTARSLLAEGGVMVLNFAAHRFFIADRIATVLREVFAQDSIVFRIPQSIWGYGGVMFLSGDLNAVRQQIQQEKRLGSLIAQWQTQHPLPFTYTTEITTDDWPYFYLDSRRIPILYYVLALMLLGLFFYTKKRFKFSAILRNWDYTHGHFFFLGAAFLLLEVQNISKASVVLGNTWQVNAVIISGILLMILLANLVAAVFREIPLRWVYAGLVSSCLALYFVDLARFAFLPYYEKAFIVGIVTAVPVFFSGIVFVRSFAAAPKKDQALGANLMGSLVGGLLQSVTFITGIRALLLIVAALYCAAALCSRNSRTIPVHMQDSQ